MDQFTHESLIKLAQDVGQRYGIPFPGMEKTAEAPSYVGGLDPQTEWMLRMRTAAAAKMKHLPPELAYALTGETPLTTSPESNVRIQQALERAADPKRALKRGLGYGIPGAALGGLVGHLVSGGEPLATAAGAAAGGGGLGYSAYRGERKMQEMLANQLAQARTEYQASEEQALMQQLEAQAQMEQAMQAEQAAQEMAQYQQRGRGRTKQAAQLDERVNQPYDASDPGRKWRGTPPRLGSERDSEEKLVDTPTMGVGWGEKRSSAIEEAEDDRLRRIVMGVAGEMRHLEKGAVASPPTGAGVGAMGSPRPPSPSGGGFGTSIPPRQSSNPTSPASIKAPPAGTAGGVPPGAPVTRATVEAQPGKGMKIPGPRIHQGPAPQVPTPAPAGPASVPPAMSPGVTASFNQGGMG